MASTARIVSTLHLGRARRAGIVDRSYTLRAYCIISVADRQNTCQPLLFHRHSIGACLLKDHYGRQISYLRISVTDRCNLRCRYCMPAEQRGFVPSEDLLTPLEIEQLAQAAVSLGFDKLRLTGGEPTLRRDIVEIVERLARVPGVRELLMTTNGIRLPWLADPLAQAGLRRGDSRADRPGQGPPAPLGRFKGGPRTGGGPVARKRAGLRPVDMSARASRGEKRAGGGGAAHTSLLRG
ncbi:MAG: radical SAM protein, partial [Ardenticatenia bacterium]|nr:radical SAM protein [Ardenticatenia bacterium]